MSLGYIYKIKTFQIYLQYAWEKLINNLSLISGSGEIFE